MTVPRKLLQWYTGRKKLGSTINKRFVQNNYRAFWGTGLPREHAGMMELSSIEHTLISNIISQFNNLHDWVGIPRHGHIWTPHGDHGH